jgi:DNA polymerase-3 subunit epsilon
MNLSTISSLSSFTAIDFETANGNLNSICQVGLVRINNGSIVKEIELLVQPPNNEYHWGNSRVHGINKRSTLHAPSFDEVWPELEPYISNQHVVAHNAAFDCAALDHTLRYYQLPVPAYKKHCTVEIYKRNLALLCAHYGIELAHHNALSDAKACAALFQIYLQASKEGVPFVPEII